MKTTFPLIKLFLGLAAFAALILYCIYAYLDISRNSARKIETTTFNELLICGIEARLETSRTYFQLGTILFGSLWAFLHAIPTRNRTFANHIGELLFFASAIIALCHSFYFHNAYVDEISLLCYDIGQLPGNKVPNLFESRVELCFSYQRVYFWYGFFAAVFCFLFIFVDDCTMTWTPQAGSVSNGAST